MLPALFGTSGSQIDQQVVDSAWLSQMEPLALAAPPAVDAPVALAAAAPEAEAAVLSAPQPVEPWATMELREGDTLYDLAYWFGVSAEDIAAANGMTLDDYAVIGATIVIPIPQSQFTMPPVPVLYVAELEPEPEPEPVLAQTAQVVAVPTVTPTPPKPVFTGTSSDVVAAICSLPWPCDKMVRIATCESGLNPNSKNPAGYYGLFQINFYFDGWNDPLTNAQTAYYSKYLPATAGGGDGTSPWPHCRHS
jgi:hypothetical protein